MRSWCSLVKMIFDFFKRLFGLIDEGSRKRRADDIDNDRTNKIVSPKKHCCGRENIPVGKVICVDENDEEGIEFLGESRCRTIRSRERSNGASSTRRKFTGTCQRTCRHNSASRMNGEEKKPDNYPSKMGATSSSVSRYSTLTRTNQLREKQEYGQLLQRFLPQRSYATCEKAPEAASRRRPKVAEVIDLETCETPVTSAIDSRRKSHQVFSTPATSTPLAWHTPRDSINLSETPRATFRNNEGSIARSRKSLNARGKNDETTILEARTPTVKTGATMTKVVPMIRVDATEVSPCEQSARKSPAAKSEEASSSRNRVEIIRTNSLRDNLAAKAVMKHDFVPRISDHYNERYEQRMKEAEELKRMTCLLAKHNRLAREAALEEQLAKSMRLCEAVLDETEEQDEAALPELTPRMIQEINQALIPNPPNEILVESFGLRVTRKDIHTLSGLNWLNDEVINFYMNLLITRGTNSDKYPKVHAMNTFFYPKLLSGGHSSLKRWTRKIDIFAQDILVVPIHLGIHWCMSIVDFREKTIRYFDSMGGSNPKCLATLRRYLEDESIDKRRKPLDTNDWKLESMKDIPQQMNGSDCGVFSCVFAEFITANRKITFTQQDMPYFRNKMVYEIIKSELL